MGVNSESWRVSLRISLTHAGVVTSHPRSSRMASLSVKRAKLARRILHQCRACRNHGSPAVYASRNQKCPMSDPASSPRPAMIIHILGCRNAASCEKKAAGSNNATAYPQTHATPVT